MSANDPKRTCQAQTQVPSVQVLAYSRLGCRAEAQAEVEKVLKINLTITVQAGGRVTPSETSNPLRYCLDLLQSGLAAT